MWHLPHGSLSSIHKPKLQSVIFSFILITTHRYNMSRTLSKSPTPPSSSSWMNSSPEVEPDSGQPLTNRDHAPGTPLTNGEHTPDVAVTDESCSPTSSPPTPRALLSDSDEELLGAIEEGGLSELEMTQMDQFVNQRLRHRQIQLEALARSQREPSRLFRSQPIS